MAVWLRETNSSPCGVHLIVNNYPAHYIKKHNSTLHCHIYYSKKMHSSVLASIEERKSKCVHIFTLRECQQVLKK